MEGALKEMQQETPFGGQQEGLALVYHTLRRDKDSDTALSRMEADDAGDMAGAIAEVYAFRGQKDQAFQ